MPTITPGTIAYGTILYATANANVREGPSVGYSAIAKLKTGQQVTALGSVTSDGELWVTVAAGQWVAGKLLADKPPAAAGGGGGGGGSPPPPYTPTPSGDGNMGTVVAVVAALAAGYAAYKWASKVRK
jgi:uncharacterized protein YgiM (DUF1202 family)